MLRIGIIGTGRIVQRFIPEARTVDGTEIVCVYNPRLVSAKKCAETYKIPKFIDKIEVFLKEVDAVYIASPHETHVDYCRQMLEAGKHVLCEKPLSFSKKDAEELYAMAEKRNIVLMEALKTAYCPGFQAVLNFIQEGKIGTVVDVEAAFTKLTQSNLREFWNKTFAGAFAELGSYVLLPIVKILGTSEKNVSYWNRDALLGCDAYTKVMFDYETATATAKVGLGAKSEGQLLITGTKGYILVPAPWWLTKRVEVHYENANATEVYEYPYEEAGLRYEVQAFLKQIEDGTMVSLEESLWMAKQMEHFLSQKRGFCYKETKSDKKIYESQGIDISQEVGNEKEVKIPNIWAHRGCSMAYPENTLEAFRAAAELEGITGIELDVQLTWDKELVVIHDEKVDRTTNRRGYVAEYTLAELKTFEIRSVNGTYTKIPTLREVLELLAPYCKEKGLLINIELKNSVNRYAGMEEKTLDLVEQFHLENYVVYSSFLPESVGLIKELCPQAKTGTLAVSMEKSLRDAKMQNADALHPWNGGMDLFDRKPYEGYPIRVWNNEEPFFGQDRVLKETNMIKYAKLGATDIITNVPEFYL